MNSKLRLTLCAVLSLAVVAQESVRRSVWDGVYTKQQADRGEVQYGRHCLECHGDELEGDAEAPALAGADFLYKWNGVMLDHLFQRIHRDMPLYKAGTMSSQASADILAYVLSANGLPAGKTELPRDEHLLKQIRLEPKQPTAGKP